MPALVADPTTTEQEVALVISELPNSYGSILLATFGGLL